MAMATRCRSVMIRGRGCECRPRSLGLVGLRGPRSEMSVRAGARADGN